MKLNVNLLVWREKIALFFFLIFFVGAGHAQQPHLYCKPIENAYLRNLDKRKINSFLDAQLVAEFLLFGENCDQKEVYRKCLKKRIMRCSLIKKLAPN
jgi:hypothetical protein